MKLFNKKSFPQPYASAYEHGSYAEESTDIGYYTCAEAGGGYGASIPPYYSAEIHQRVGHTSVSSFYCKGL